jgi:hypothetical protein
MSYRRSLLGLLGGAVLAVAACAGTGTSGAPSLALPSITIPSGALPSVALEGFCADFQSKIAAKWPNIDASTAVALAPVVSQWADMAELAEVKADVTTIAAWITTMATAGSVSTPPPDVTTAFDDIKAFADSKC